MAIRYEEHFFGQNQTIEAVIKHINKNETMSERMLEYLVDEFNKANGANAVPMMGQCYKIPVAV